MKKASKCAVAILMFAVILFGMKNYMSLNGFIKPVIWQMIFGYSTNEVPEDAGVNDKLLTVTSEIETMFVDNNHRYQYINLNGLFQNLIEKRYVSDIAANNDVIKLKNGYLTFLQKEYDITQVAESTVEFNSFLSEKGIDFLYLQVPHKISKYSPNLPYGLQDFSNSNTDRFLESVSLSGIKALDLREEIYNAGLNQYDFFFKTDHHWTPEGAFWAFRRVSEELKENYGFDIDEKTLDINNYSIRTLDDWFLGSQGKRTGKLYAGVDDFSIITPNFETEFTVTTFTTDTSTVKGDFEKTMILTEHIQPRDYFNKNPYAVYTGGDFPLQIVTNHKSPNDKKIVLIRNSFACAFSPFLALNCQELHIIDLRHYKDGTTAQYIEKVNPDMIMIMYDGFSEKMFSFM